MSKLLRSAPVFPFFCSRSARFAALTRCVQPAEHHMASVGITPPPASFPSSILPPCATRYRTDYTTTAPAQHVTFLQVTTPQNEAVFTDDSSHTLTRLLFIKHVCVCERGFSCGCLSPPLSIHMRPHVEPPVASAPLLRKRQSARAVLPP